MKKFLLILILFTLAGACFAQNNGKLPTINTSSSKTAPKSKMPTISGVSNNKPAPQAAKPVQKPMQDSTTANPTETKEAPATETVEATNTPVETDGTPTEVTETPEEPSLLKAASEAAKRDEPAVSKDVVPENPESETVEPQSSEPEQE